MDDRELEVTPTPVLEDLPAYSVGRLPNTDLVLDFNESLAPPSPLTAELNRYPDIRPPLQAEIADRFAVSAESVLVTCGADDALERAVRCVTWPGRPVVLTDPTYSMIRRFSIAAGARITQVPWWSGALPVTELCAAAGDNAGLMAVVSPANPTGLVASRDELERLLDAVPKTLVIVDQAYVDFANPEFDLTEVTLRHPNAVLIRTFSKAWGAAGVRVGFAVGDPRIIDWMRRIGLPFPVSRTSSTVISSVFAAGPDHDRIERICQERAELGRRLGELGVETWTSQGSFVLARFKDSELVFRGLAALGIAVRNLGRQSNLDGCLRFTLPGDNELFERLWAALRTVLTPEALLLDMDGVMVDVRDSYRTAIVETAASWGLEVTAADIVRIKAAGDANNDWVVTQRLLAEGGVEAELSEITRRFEALYQGNDQSPGLRDREHPLLTRTELEQLVQRCPVAVVTGRPRRDAEYFLERHGLADLVTTVVCMEDGPAKPDPAPVKLALERLGVTSAWLLGDTPDDIRAARSANVLPVAVPAPGEDNKTARAILESAGAARVLSRPSEILEVFS